MKMPQKSPDRNTAVSTVDFQPAHSPGLLESELAGDLVVFDSEQHVVHSLNSTASVIWRLCDGTRSVEDLVEDMGVLFDEHTADMEGDVKRTVEELTGKGLLQDGPL